MFDPVIKAYVLPSLGKLKFVDSTNSVRDLGLAYRPANECILEGAQDLIENGHVKPPPSATSKVVKMGVKFMFFAACVGGFAYYMQNKGYVDLEQIKATLFGS